MKVVGDELTKINRLAVTVCYVICFDFTMLLKSLVAGTGFEPVTFGL